MRTGLPSQQPVLERVHEYIARGGPATLPLAVVGDPGAGKTTLRKLVHADLESANHPTAVVDCWRLRTPQKVELISEICSQLPGGQDAIEDALTIALGSPGEGARAFDALKRTLRNLVEKLDRPAILIDGFQRLPESLRNWLVKELRSLGGSTRVVIFTETTSDVVRSELLHIPRLGVGDVLQLVAERGTDEISAEAQSNILRISNGNASQVLLCLAAVERLAVKGGSLSDMESIVDALIVTLSDSERLLLRLAAEFVVPRDARTFSRVSRAFGLPIGSDCVEKLKSLALLADSSDDEPIRVAATAIHQVVSSQSRATILKAAKSLYDHAGEHLLKLRGFEDLDLVLARLRYELAVDQPTALSRMRTLVGKAIRESRLDDANAIISLAEREPLAPFEGLRAAHMRARYHIADYDAEAGWNLLRSTSLIARDMDDAEALAEQFLLEACCSVNPSPMPHSDLFEAVRLLGNAKELLPAGSALLPEIHHTMGIALRSIGQSNESIASFSAAAAIATQVGDLESALIGMGESVQSYRYLQDLGSARSALRSAFEFNGEHNLGGSALLTYFSANLLRDEGMPSDARARYAAAARELELASDEYGLCCLYGDWAWLEYLEGDFLAAHDYLDKSLTLATRFRFGTEIAEYWHSRFHLARDEGDLKSARDFIARGAEEARASSNIYMILDCGMHTAEFHRLDKDPHRIRLIVDEMQALERRGCGIKVFRGRTQVVYAASLFEHGEEGPAFDAYLEGLETVAQFGNSRSNVETFDDILRVHTAEITKLLTKYGWERPRARWIELNLRDRFPQFLSLCDAAEKIAGE